MKKEDLLKAIFKRAVGYDFEESTEEFVVDDKNGEVKNCKKRVSKKHSPPDIPAARTFFELSKKEKISKYDNMSEEELLAERERLLKELAQEKLNQDSKKQKENKAKVS